MRALTFNIQHGRNFRTGDLDLPRMAQVIADSGADLVSLNEVYRLRGEGGDQCAVLARLLCESTGDAWRGEFARAIDIRGGEYGNGILTRLPLRSVRATEIPSPPRTHEGYYEDRCLLEAQLSTPLGDLTALICHFGLQPEEGERAVQAITRLLDGELHARRVILAGDFNLTPDSPLLEPLRARLDDSAGALTGDGFTFPSNAPDRKIDYIFVSRNLRVTRAEVIPVIASDHRPLLAEVEAI